MKIAVIGGTRGLGEWIARFLKSKGFDITVTGRDEIAGERVSKKLGVDYTSSNTSAASQADVVIVSVPIDVTLSAIKEVAPVMKKGSLIMDVTSVKEEPSRIMQEYVPYGVEVLPIHPMFGPRIRSLDGQVIVVTPTNKGRWYNKVYNFFERENARIIVTTPEIHDQMMSVVQGLTHLAYISIAATIEKLDVDIKESRNFASPIYDLMVDMIARIVAQNPYLYYSIQTHNKYTKKTHETFISIYKELNEMISSGNEEGFVKVMGSAAKHMDDLEAALGRSDKAISALTEEVNILKGSIGKEVGLRHIYSGKVHIGILKGLSHDFLTLEINGKKTKLKLSNVEILSDKEIYDLKVENYLHKTYFVSAVFPENCSPDIIVNTIEGLKGVIGASVDDMYHGSQIPSGKISITIKYEVINSDARFDVENLLKGFGAVIR
ncbi:prephenate dehydrogenase [Methanobacterium sp.]|uniref:prephenate dehydrogenase n=1 Tax=Methanobacterium sp. TaxID=2164 RepID=UPI003159881F